MNNMIDKIKQILDDEAIRGSLSLDALNLVNDLRSEAEKAIEENKGLKERNTELSDQKNEANNLNYNLTEEINKLTKEATEVAAEAKKTLIDNIRNEYDVKRGDEMKELLGMALRNTTIRSSMFGSESIMDTNGYATSVPVNKDTTKTAE